MATKAKIILFQYVNFGGGSLVLDHNDPKLSDQDFNDRLSSLVVVEGTWELFEHKDYKGDPWVVSAKGGPDKDGVYPDYSAWDGKDNVISSVRLLGE